jgi:hypothetical protein
MRAARCVVIPSGARNLTFEATVALSTLCDAEPGERSFTSLRMTARAKNFLEKRAKRQKLGFRGIGILPMIHGLEAHATSTSCKIDIFIHERHCARNFAAG